MSFSRLGNSLASYPIFCANRFSYVGQLAIFGRAYTIADASRSRVRRAWEAPRYRESWGPVGEAFPASNREI